MGNNPTNIQMYVYKPYHVKRTPGLLLALHYCGGTAQQYFDNWNYRKLADERGFMILYPQAPNFNNCWDVTSAQSLTHEGGSDSLGLASAVRYAIKEWGVDPNKVFVTGTSSGAMMTNVLCAAYPDLFKAGAAFAGVAVGCLQGNQPAFPPDPCAAGNVTRSPQEWGDIVRNAYPGYVGKYPRLQIWHGTADTAIEYSNLEEQVKQWTDVHNVSQKPTSTVIGDPKSGWTKSVFGNGQVESFLGQGVGHGIPEAGTEAVALDFFGL